MRTSQVPADLAITPSPGADWATGSFGVSADLSETTLEAKAFGLETILAALGGVLLGSADRSPVPAITVLQATGLRTGASAQRGGGAAEGGSAGRLAE